MLIIIILVLFLYIVFIHSFLVKHLDPVKLEVYMKPLANTEFGISQSCSLIKTALGTNQSSGLSLFFGCGILSLTLH